MIDVHDELKRLRVKPKPISDPWRAPTLSAALNKVVSLPGSKSLTNRELVLSALANGPSLLRKPLLSRDTDLMIEALQKFGVTITKVPAEGGFGPDLLIMPDPELRGNTVIDCGLAGTVMRFVPPLALLANGEVEFTGDEQAMLRPMSGTLAALRELGAVISPEDASTLPFTVQATGSVAGGKIKLDASKSSQFVSGVLLSAARYRNGVELSHTGDKLPSMPHIEMTLAALRARGVQAERLSSGSWKVKPGVINGATCTIEPDLSNAAPFLAAALVAGGRVSIKDWPSQTTQVGASLIPILEKFGAKFELSEGILTIDGGAGVRRGQLPGVQLDLSEGGELAPTIVGLAALAASESVIYGIGHLRGHETDRLAALVHEVNNLGGDAEELEDGIRIRPAKLTGGLWHSYHDHRIATTGALIGLAVTGVKVENIATTAKTMPEFPELWRSLVAK